MDEGVVAAYNLGNDLLQQGKLAEAVSAYRSALALEPAFADAHNNLGVALRRQGNLDEALACHDRALALMPGHPDALINSGQLLFLRARRGLAPLPQNAPASFVESLYNKRAADWDRSAAHGSKYLAPGLVADALNTSWHRATKPAVLDAGCGTGLVGELVHESAGRLEGVDLSSAMLEAAKAKGIYHRLYRGDLVAFLAEHTLEYDVVLCAATFIHMGDLHPALAAACGALRAGGLLIFTVFPLDSEASDYTIAPMDALRLTGCFAHSERYVAMAAEGTGFKVERLSRVIHEFIDQRPVPGLLGVIRKSSR